MPLIELIGSLDESAHYETCRIQRILQNEVQALQQGSAFMGRPQTQIHADADAVVKIRADLDLPLADARDWVLAQLAKERRLQAHHAHKTWFIQSEGAFCRIGNISPRLHPLHLVYVHAPGTEAARLRYRQLLNALLRMYFALAKNHAIKLDEGLSNFGVDRQDRLYYLDDEFYAWDNGVALAMMIGVFLRNIPWLDTAFAKDMGQTLRHQMQSVFPGMLTDFANHLNATFMPDARKEALRAALLATLSARPAEHQNRPSSVPDRYWAILADIHANTAALDRALDFYRAQGIRHGLVLGDIVGYGPEPKACIDRLMACGFVIIRGNHDHAVATGCLKTGFSEHARFVIDWTRQQLSVTYRQWLADLPTCVHLEELGMAVHGAPIDPEYFNAYVYAMTYADNLDFLQRRGLRFCFHGHSHLPGAYVHTQTDVRQHRTEARIVLSDCRQALISPGSVGQSRNGEQQAQCAIYDKREQVLHQFSLNYAIMPVVQKMRNSGFPESLCRRLLNGR